MHICIEWIFAAKKLTVVEFDGSLAELGGFIERIPSKVQSTVTVVTNEFGFVVQPVGITVDNFGNSEESSHLVENIHTITGFHEGRECLQTIRNVLCAREADSSSSDQVSNNSKHGDASVLQFTFTKSIELGLVAIRDESQRIEETQLKVLNRKYKCGEKMLTVKVIMVSCQIKIASFAERRLHQFEFNDSCRIFSS